MTRAIVMAMKAEMASRMIAKKTHSGMNFSISGSGILAILHAHA